MGEDRGRRSKILVPRSGDRVQWAPPLDRVVVASYAPMPDLPLTGGCLCGGVRYEISAPLVSAGYCHCTRCQRRTGTAAAASAKVAPGSFSVVAGREHVRAYDPGDGGFLKSFCVLCGGALYSSHPEHPDVLGVRLGGIDGDPGIRPQYHQRVETAAVWRRCPTTGCRATRAGAGGAGVAAAQTPAARRAEACAASSSAVVEGRQRAPVEARARWPGASRRTRRSWAAAGRGGRCR